MALNYQIILCGSDDSKLVSHMKSKNITQNMLEESVQKLKEWFEIQPHLPKIQLDERFLKGVLFFNAFSMEKAKYKLDNFFAMKSFAPEFFSDRNIDGPGVSLSKEAAEIMMIPKVIKSRIIVVRNTQNYLDKFDGLGLLKVVTMLLEIRLYYDTTFNDEIVIDLDEFTMHHLKRYTVSALSKMLYMSRSCYSTKLDRVHIVNAKGAALTFANLLKTLVKKKIADRFIIHENLESLHECLDLECLPNELGGTAGTYRELSNKFYECLETDEWRKKIAESNQFKTDESKRPQDMKGSFSETFGVPGSFRKIDID